MDEPGLKRRMVNVKLSRRLAHTVVDGQPKEHLVTRPPYDPELGAVLATIPDELRRLMWLRPQDLEAFRAYKAASRPDPATVERSGAVQIQERTIPGPTGAPDLDILLLTPTAAATVATSAQPRPAIYGIHGGGLVAGDHWDMVEPLAAWVEELGVVGVSVSPYAAPARAQDLHGLPPALIDVGQVDTLRDEALQYAARLAQSGVPVEFHLWPGVWHGADYVAPQAAISQLSNGARTAYLRRVLGL